MNIASDSDIWIEIFFTVSLNMFFYPSLSFVVTKFFSLIIYLENTQFAGDRFLCFVAKKFSVLLGWNCVGEADDKTPRINNIILHPAAAAARGLKISIV